MKRPDGWVKERLYDGAPNFIGFFDIDPFHISSTGVIDDVERREWEPALVGGNEGLNVNVAVRDSLIQKFQVGDVDCHYPLLVLAEKCVDDYLFRFPEACKFPPVKVEKFYNVLKYEKGQAYHATHTDYFPAGYFGRRHLTGVCFLSNVAEGGELVFPQQGVVVKPEVGQMIIFPSGWTHAHHTLPVLSDDVRYVFQLWWSFDEPS